MCDAAPTPLGQWIAAWLTHQRSLGRGYNGEQWVLTHLQRFVGSGLLRAGPALLRAVRVGRPERAKTHAKGCFLRACFPI
jgi:hypothetical protein